jgi:citrate synthase
MYTAVRAMREETSTVPEKQLPTCTQRSRPRQERRGGGSTDGTNEQVMRTLEAISKAIGGDTAAGAVEPQVMRWPARGEKIMGIGQAGDPRAAQSRQMCAERARPSGDGTRYGMSRRMEEVVFAAKGPYPNVDVRA